MRLISMSNEGNSRENVKVTIEFDINEIFRIENVLEKAIESASNKADAKEFYIAWRTLRDFAWFGHLSKPTTNLIKGVNMNES